MRPVIVGYYPEWGIYERKFNVADAPAEALDVINYAFANIKDGKIALSDPWADVQKPFPGDAEALAVKGNFHQLVKLKARNRKLKSLISIGGWTLSGKFSDVALTDTSRRKFSRSVVDFCKRYGFDGADIDWEYPGGGGLASNKSRPADPHNFSLLLARLRADFDAQGVREGRKYYLSAALPAGNEQIRSLEIDAIARSLDWANLMTYDFHGGQDATTNHQAPVYGAESVDGAVGSYLKAGMPAGKLNLGIPAYGRSWKDVGVVNHGLFQRARGVPKGSWDDTGVFDYKDLLRKEKTAAWTRYWDSAAQAPWLYAPTLNGGTFVTFEDNRSLVYKLDYLQRKGLGGLMLWDLSSDSADPASSLVLAARRRFP